MSWIFKLLAVNRKGWRHLHYQMTLIDFKKASKKMRYIEGMIRANLFFMVRNGNLYSYLVGSQNAVMKGRFCRCSINGELVSKKRFNEKIKRLL